MSMLLSLGLAAANAIMGGVSAGKQKREQLASNARAAQETRSWRDRVVTEDATQRADAQRIITRANDAIKKRTLAAQGKSRVIGGTDASMAATQQANAEQMGNAVSTIAANAEARKDAAENEARRELTALEKERSNIIASAEAAKRQAMSEAATSGIQALASDDSSLFDVAKKAKGTTYKGKVKGYKGDQIAQQATDTMKKLGLIKG